MKGSNELFEFCLGEWADVSLARVLVLYGLVEDEFVFRGVDFISGGVSREDGGYACGETEDKIIWYGRIFVYEARGL